MLGILFDPFPNVPVAHLNHTVCKQAWYYTLMFANNYVHQMVGMFGCVPQSWTVAVEFQFYLISPALVYLLRMGERSKSRYFSGSLVLLFLFLLFTGIRCAVILSLHLTSFSPNQLPNKIPEQLVQQINYLYQPSYTRATGYIMGMAAAYFVKTLSPEHFLRGSQPVHVAIRSVGYLVSLTCIVVGIIYGVLRATAFTHADPADPLHPTTPTTPTALFFYFVFRRSAFTFGFAFVIAMAGIGKARLFRSVAGAKVWFPLAQLSYSIYLLQFYAIPLSLLYFSPYQNREYSLPTVGQLLVEYLLIVLVSLVMAFVSYVLVERPCMALRS